jgi:transposase
VLTAQTVIAEAGADLSAFPVEKQFVSWLGLCPTNETSGGKVLKQRTRKVVNRASTAFRNAASTLLRRQSRPGAQYRRLRTRLGPPKPSRRWPQTGVPVLSTYETRIAVCR